MSQKINFPNTSQIRRNEKKKVFNIKINDLVLLFFENYKIQNSRYSLSHYPKLTIRPDF